MERRIGELSTRLLEHLGQADTARFFGAILGPVSIPAFFAPENVQRILAGGGVSLPETAESGAISSAAE